MWSLQDWLPANANHMLMNHSLTVTKLFLGSSKNYHPDNEKKKKTEMGSSSVTHENEHFLVGFSQPEVQHPSQHHDSRNNIQSNMFPEEELINKSLQE